MTTNKQEHNDSVETIETVEDLKDPINEESAVVRSACESSEDGENQLLKLQNDIQELKNAVMLEKADNENLRKRHKREIENSIQYGLTKFAQELVEVLENLHRARSHVKVENINDPTTQSIVDGIEMTIKSFESVLAQNGIKRLFPLKEEFNHQYHQAIAQIPSNTEEENTILEVIQAGYIIHDRLLKPAMVAVAKKPV